MKDSTGVEENDCAYIKVSAAHNCNEDLSAVVVESFCMDQKGKLFEPKTFGAPIWNKGMSLLSARSGISPALLRKARLRTRPAEATECSKEKHTDVQSA